VPGCCMQLGQAAGPGYWARLPAQLGKTRN
jgi:hypothetical protein